MEPLQTGLREVEGTVALIQEDRFRLQAEDGRSMLFVLGRSAGASMSDLEMWASRGSRVRVRYRGEPDAGAVADWVWLLHG